MAILPEEQGRVLILKLLSNRKQGNEEFLTLKHVSIHYIQLLANYKTVLTSIVVILDNQNLQKIAILSPLNEDHGITRKVLRVICLMQLEPKHSLQNNHKQTNRQTYQPKSVSCKNIHTRHHLLQCFHIHATNFILFQDNKFIMLIPWTANQWYIISSIEDEILQETQ